jgi:hypothetical protein
MGSPGKTLQTDLSAQLERHLLQVRVGGSDRDAPTGNDAPREGDFINVGVAGNWPLMSAHLGATKDGTSGRAPRDSVASRPAEAGDSVDNAGGNAGLDGELAQRERRQR